MAPGEREGVASWLSTVGGAVAAPEVDLVKVKIGHEILTSVVVERG